MEKTFIHPETQKQWNIRVTDSCVYTQLDNRKVKEIRLKDTSPYGVRREVAKLMMAQMKKGFVHHNPNAGSGEAVLHRYLDAGYTGFMPVSAWPGQSSYYVTRTIGRFEDEVIYQMDFTGSILKEYHNGPGRLTYETVMSRPNSLLMNEHYQLQTLHLDTGVVEESNGARDSMQFMMDQEGSVVLFYDKPSIVVYDGESDKEVYRQKVEPQPTGQVFATYYCRGMLSPNGKFLLYRVKESGYSMVDLETGRETFIADTGWQIFFSPDNQYVSIGGRCYHTLTGEIETSNPFPFSVKTDAIYTEKLNVKCSGNLMIVNGFPCPYQFTVWDYSSQKKLVEIDDLFVVKDANYIIHDQCLIVHTDRGVVSIYRLE